MGSGHFLLSLYVLLLCSVLIPMYFYDFLWFFRVQDCSAASLASNVGDLLIKLGSGEVGIHLSLAVYDGSGSKCI